MSGHGTKQVERLLRAVLVSALPVALACGPGDADPQPETPQPPASPRVVIMEPAEGAQLDTGIVRIVMQAENIALAPAGEDRPNSGHLHLFVNAPVTAAGAVIPAGVEGTVHLGQAQTTHELSLVTPGEYVVIAVLGDFAHRTIEPQAMDTVRFLVRAP